MRSLFDRRDKKNITTIGHDQHDLARVSPLVRVNQKVLEAIFLDCRNHFFKGYAAPGLKAFVLVRIPPERLHSGSLSERVPFVISLERAVPGAELCAVIEPVRPRPAVPPKGCSMTSLTQRHCDAIAARLNRRPRKSMNFKTPEQIYATS